MTVIIPSRQFSIEDRRRLVLEYLEQPHGSKAAFLRDRQIGADQFRRWRAALADGDLDTDQVPRKTGVMTRRDAAEVRRLHGVLDKRLAEHAFLAGPEYGIADMASYPWIEVYGDLKPDYAAFPHVKRWHDAIAARPATQRAYALKDKVNPDAGKPLSEEERKHLFGKR